MAEVRRALVAPIVHPMRERDPRQVGPWVLTGRIGAGGMGTVYLANHSQTGAVAAVKVMSDSLADQPEFRTRFAREIQILRRVQGPFVAEILDGDAWAELPWVATEYVPGPNLARLVEEHGALDPESWEGLAAGLLSALSRLHDEGVVHRDMKPANVLLAPEGPRLIDFGIAQLSDATALTTTGAALGTLSWLSPEQISGSPATPLSDAFSAGAVLAFSATGRPPFGDGPPAATVRAVMHDGPDLLGVSEETRVLLEGLLVKEPSSRWTAAKAALYLAGSMEHGLLDQHATTKWRQGELTQLLSHDQVSGLLASAGSSLPHQAAARPSRRWRRWAVGAVAVAALVAGWIIGPGLVQGMGNPGITVEDVPSPTGEEPDASSEVAPESAPGDPVDPQFTGSFTSVVESVPIEPAMSEGDTLRAVAISPDGAYGYTAGPTDSPGGGSVAVVDLATDTQVGMIALDSYPRGLAVSPDGDQLFVAAGFDQGKLLVVDVAARAVSGSISVGEMPGGVAVSPDGATIYVATEGGISIVDRANDSVRTVDAGHEVSDVVVSPDGDYAYATGAKMYGDGPPTATVAVIETAANELVDSIPVSVPPAGLTLSPDGKLLYVATHAEGSSRYGGLVQIIDTAGRTVATSVDVGGGLSAIAASPDGAYLYVSKFDSDSGAMVQVVDTVSNDVVESIPVASFNQGMAITPDGTKGYLTGQDRLYVLG